MAGAGRLAGMILAMMLGAGGLPPAILASDQAPLTLRTPSVQVVYHRPQDVAEMERRLDLCRGSPTSQVWGGESRLSGRCEARLAAKIEILLARVSKLLYLTAPSQARLHIHLLADGLAVRRHYALHHGRNTGLAYHPLEAYYDAAGRTIYLSLADLRPGILAHWRTTSFAPRFPGRRPGKSRRSGPVMRKRTFSAPLGNGLKER